MALDPDPGIFKTALDWAWGVVLALLGILHRVHNKQMQDIREAVGGKAENSEMTRQRDNIGDIFDKIEATNSRIGKIEVSAARIETQVGHIASDIESDKRDRAQSTQNVMDALNRLESRRRK